MANLSSVFQDALADHAKAALVEIVANNPKTSVKDLRDLVGDNPALGGVTLSELLGASGGRGGRRKASAPGKGKGKGGAPRKGGAHKRNVRTESGREAFDTEVLDALKTHGGDTVAATQLRESLNADPTQLRTSLNRLIERGVVTFTGKARGTRYSMTS